MTEKLSDRVSGLEAHYEHTRNQLSEIFGELKLVAKKDDVRDIIHEHQVWEEQAHKTFQESCTIDRKQLNERISALEKWKWVITGGAAVVGFLANKFSKFL